MEDEDALLAGLEMPTFTLQKPSIFNIKAGVQVAMMEDFDNELPDPMPTLKPLGQAKPFALDYKKLQFPQLMLNPSLASIIPPMQ